MKYIIKLKKRENYIKSYSILVYSFKGKILDNIGSLNSSYKVGNVVYKQVILDKKKVSNWLLRGVVVSKSVLKLINFSNEKVK